MTDAHDSQREPPAASPANEPVQAMRVDSAHLPSDGALDESPVVVPEKVLSAAAGLNPEHLADQLRWQANQLADHLQSQQSDLDRRESQMNACTAQMENELRSVRMLLSEQEHQVHQQQQSVRERESELEQRILAVSTAEMACEQDQEEFQQQGKRIQQNQIELEEQEHRVRVQQQQFDSRQESSMQMVRHLMRALQRRQASVEEQAERFQVMIENPALAKQLTESVEQLQARQSYLDKSEELLNRHLEEVEKDRQRLQREREQIHQQARKDRQRVATRQRQDEGEILGKKQVLDRQTDNLEQRSTALEQLQAEVSRIHQETLEMRLATETLWAQMSSKTTPARLTQSLGTIRAKLADHYKLANNTLAQQKEELQSLGEKLGQQQANLKAKRQELEQWVNHRHEEIEHQAARLVAREQELDRQEGLFRQQEKKWDQQRRNYEQQLRELMAQVRQVEVLPA